jgi:hypothetical protein
MSETTNNATRPPISDARRRANALNAQKSTGPRTEAGKRNSKFNNLKDCIYAEEMILPGENEAELETRYQRWVAQLGACTDPERYEVLNAVHASWRHDRLRRADTNALRGLVETTAETFYDQKEQEARALVDRLAQAPAEAICGLRGSRAGLNWMLGQVALLEEQLATHNGLQVT